MKSKETTKRLLYSAISSWIILFAIALIVKRPFVETLDLNFFEWIYNLQSAHSSVWLAITQMGSIIALALVVGVLWVSGKHKIALVVAGDGLIAYAVCWMLKELVARPRPAYILPAVQTNDWSAVGYGFPSAHVAIITTIVLLLITHSKESYRYILWATVVLVALSRIFLGVHTPLDVVGGFLVGYSVTQTTLLLMARKS